MEKRFVPRISESGKSHEADAFGRPQLNEELYKRTLATLVEKYKPQAKKPGWIPFADARDLLIKSTLPLKPKRPFVNELRVQVAQKLNVDNNQIRIFSALDTPLDHFHGTDAIVRYLEMDGTPVDVKVDITQNESKDAAKADVIISAVEVDPESNKQAFEKGVADAADAVASALRTNINALRRTQSGERYAWRAKPEAS
jgi:hypothetical protein